MSTATTRRGLLAGATAALAGLAGCSSIVDRDEREEIDRTFDVADVDALSVATRTGDVDVRGADRSDVRVTGVKRAASQEAIDALQLQATRAAGTLDLSTTVEGEPWPVGFWRTPRLDLTVEVPRDRRVERAEATTGDVDVRDVRGPIVAETDTGDVDVSGVRERLVAEADTGDVAVDGEEVDRLTTDTGGVDATIRGLASPATIETDTGDAAVALAADLDVTVSVSVDTGEADVGDGFDSVRIQDGSGEVVLGDGSGALTVTTDTGDVTLRTLA